MKHALVVLLVMCCGWVFAQGHRIQFKIAGMPDSLVTIGYHMGSQKYALDTLSIINDSFVIEGDEPLKPGLYFIYNSSYYLEFIVKEQKFSIAATYGKGYDHVVVKGSEENELFSDFQTDMIGFRNQQRAYQEQLSNNTGDSARTLNDLKAVEQAMAQYRKDLISDHPDKFLSAFLGLMNEPEVPEYSDADNLQDQRVKQYQYYRAHYFDQVQLGNPDLIRTPLLQPKVMKYFDQVIPQHPDTINIEIDRLFEEVGDNHELFRYWLITLYNKYQESKIMGMDKVVVHLMEDYFLSGRATWLTEEGIKKIREEITFKKHSLIGNQAPEMHLVDTLNQPFYLEQISQPFILLYFYDPDCGHCKKKTPVLVEAYDDFQSLGVEIVAVCTVTDVDRWKEYIRETNMEFVNLADPSYDSNFRVYYDLRSTPKMYLLDQQRKIVAKQLEIEDIKEFVKRYTQ